MKFRTAAQALDTHEHVSTDMESGRRIKAAAARPERGEASEKVELGQAMVDALEHILKYEQRRTA